MLEQIRVAQALDDVAAGAKMHDRCLGLTFYGFQCLVRSNTAEIQSELLDRLSPFVGIEIEQSAADAARDARLRVDALVVERMPSPPTAPGERLQTRPVASARPQYYDCFPGPRFLASSQQSQAMVVAAEDGTIRVIGIDARDVAVECRRLIQDLVHIYACRRGMLNLEAAALSVTTDSGERGVLVLGRSGAGKSTLLVRLARLLPVRYVANDEVFIVQDDRTIMAHGSPVNVKIKMPSAVQYSTSDGISQRGMLTNKRSVTFRRFCASHALEVAPYIRVHGILVPFPDDQPVDVRASGISDLTRALVRWTEDWQSPWTSFVTPSVGDDGPTLAGLLRVPAWAVPWTTSDEQIVQLLQGIKE